MPTTGTTSLSHLLSRRAAETTSLDGTWKAIPDPYDVGGFSILGPAKDGWFRDRKPQHPAERIEYDFDGSLDLEVPGDWNTQIPELYYYEASLWYADASPRPRRNPAARSSISVRSTTRARSISTATCLRRTKAATARSPSRSPAASA